MHSQSGELIMHHPWHEVDIGEQVPNIVNAIIEIPKGSKAKYELDKKSGLIKMDRILFSSIQYPANYGFIPQTYDGSSSPLSILVLGQETAFPLCIMRAMPIAVMKMRDEGNANDKIVIAVHADDPEFSHISSLEELPPRRMKEIESFFEAYKKLENKIVTVEKYFDRTEVFRVIDVARERYTNTFPKQ